MHQYHVCVCWQHTDSELLPPLPSPPLEGMLEKSITPMAGLSGFRREPIHPQGELFRWEKERYMVGGGKEVEGCGLAGVHHPLQLKTLIPQGDMGPSPHITVPIHFSILPARRLIWSALASPPWARCQIARSEAPGKTITIQQRDAYAHTRMRAPTNAYTQYGIINNCVFGHSEFQWFHHSNMK